MVYLDMCSIIFFKLVPTKGTFCTTGRNAKLVWCFTVLFQWLEASLQKFCPNKILSDLRLIDPTHVRNASTVVTSQVARMSTDSNWVISQKNHWRRVNLETHSQHRPQTECVCGRWIFTCDDLGTEVGINRDSVKSHTGSLIELVADCPVLWVSKLQSAEATGTKESEYTTLSMVLQASTPLLAVVKSVLKGLKFCAKKFK